MDSHMGIEAAATTGATEYTPTTPPTMASTTNANSASSTSTAPTQTSPMSSLPTPPNRSDCVYTFSDHCDDSEDDDGRLPQIGGHHQHHHQNTTTTAKYKPSAQPGTAAAAATEAVAADAAATTSRREVTSSAKEEPMAMDSPAPSQLADNEDNFPGFTPPTKMTPSPVAAAGSQQQQQQQQAADNSRQSPDDDATDDGFQAPQAHQQQQPHPPAHSQSLDGADSDISSSPSASSSSSSVSSPSERPLPSDSASSSASRQPRRPTNGQLAAAGVPQRNYAAGGKPLTFASNNNNNNNNNNTTTTMSASTSASASAAKRAPRASRAAKPNRKVLVTMYHSQISDNTLGGIKLKLKKSEGAGIGGGAGGGSGGGGASDAAISKAAAAVAASLTGRGATGRLAAAPRSRGTGAATPRKRPAKRATGADAAESADPGAAAAAAGGPAKRSRKTPSKKSGQTQANSNPAQAEAGAVGEPVDQTDWGARLPEHILNQIFRHVVRQEGALPALVRLGKVCRLWQRASIAPSLWRTLDLTRWTKEKSRTEVKLKWLIENRCSACVDLNVSNWKIINVSCVLSLMAETCPHLVSVTFAGWKSFTSDDLLQMAEQFQSLQRIDLSSINIEFSHKSAVNIQALTLTIQLMKTRLTHLYLSNNKLAGIPQIVTALATFCPNLILLDLSNVSTVANSHGVLLLEKLQSGCPKLRVLRITNSHITLGSATLEEQMSSPGFPDLEELSVAALSDESRLINDDYLQRILKTSTKLQLLDVRGCARLTHESMIRLPAWDLKHLFLSGCWVTRDLGSGLELIASKWAHSLIEFDLAWANVQQTVDSAIRVLAEKGAEAAISHLNLCGSSVSQEAVAEILRSCPQLSSINLASCRGLPRGVKRLMQGTGELNDLREALGVPVIRKPTPPPAAGSSSIAEPVAQSSSCEQPNATAVAVAVAATTSGITSSSSSSNSLSGATSTETSTVPTSAEAVAAASVTSSAFSALPSSSSSLPASTTDWSGSHRDDEQA